MRTATCVLVVAAALASSNRAQDRPNFSGIWTTVPSRSVWYDQGRPVDISVFGHQFTANQTETVLTIAIDNERGFVWTYRLDGIESPNSPPGPQGPQATSSTVTWSGSQLAITTTGAVNQNGSPQRAETKRTLTLNEDGTLLVQAPWGPNGAMLGSVYSRVR